MKYSCEMMRDLVPLYVDKVCSHDSKQAVEEHLEECEFCKSYCTLLQQTNELSQYVSKGQFEEKQAKSMKQVKRKIRKRSRIFATIGLLVGLVTAVAIMYFVLSSDELTGKLRSSLYGATSEKVEVKVYTDASRYESYIGAMAINGFDDKWDMDETIFPEKLTDNMQVKDYKFTYYNPGDEQYIAYLTVEYGEEEYAQELSRLDKKGIEAYTGYYSVTDAPSGYQILAMDSDSYRGFVYAITPEDGEKSITYVEIIFCNYALDVDIDRYMPQQYLLEGFDASYDNAYRKKKMEK